MGQFVIGDDLRGNIKSPLKVGSEWAKAFKRKLLVLHGDRMADTDTLGSLLKRMNVDVEQNHVENMLLENTEKIRKQIEEANPEESLPIEAASRSGNGAEVLLKEARDQETDLVILGYNPKRRLREVFLGTVTEELVHKSSSSLMIVKDEKAARPKNILIAYDFSHHCDQAVQWSKELCAHFGAKATLANVVPCYYQGYQSELAATGELNQRIEEMVNENIEQAKGRLQRKVKEMKGNGNLEGVTLVDKKGSVSDRLVEHINKENIDLVLIGSHMRGKIKELFLGSVAAALIKKSPRSILVAK